MLEQVAAASRGAGPQESPSSAMASSSFRVAKRNAKLPQILDQSDAEDRLSTSFSAKRLTYSDAQAFQATPQFVHCGRPTTVLTITKSRRAPRCELWPAYPLAGP